MAPRVHRKAPRRARFNERAAIEAALQAGMFGAKTVPKDDVRATDSTMPSTSGGAVGRSKATRKAAVPSEASKAHKQPRAQMQAKFEAFHAKHPMVYAKLVRMAKRTKRQGYQHCGIAMMWEVLRWQTMLLPKGERIRLSNNHRAFYARLIETREPELLGFFTSRGPK